MAWSVAANIRQRGSGSRSGNASRERKQESDQQNMTYQQRMGATPAGYQQQKVSPQRQQSGQHSSGQHGGGQHAKPSAGREESRERERVRRGGSPPTQPKDEAHGRVRKVSKGSPVRMKRPSPAGTEHAQMSRSLPHEYMRHFPQDAMRRQEEHAQSSRRSPTEHRRRYRQAPDTERDPQRLKTRTSPEKHSSRQTQGHDGDRDRRQRKSYNTSV
ncbi:serine/arginine repetitive matrix protein 1-like [Branchiostoma floridae]|uniref:Serine/arginine repetitive matrix protein 1-like n=1 Tax=Branchiostoma floridae TaxID=7739 RepID=A0A9J7M3Z4_BRAFL|nr:serine/arginine repetitive matrix protein 1-like [Branchiostoma floridae]